MLWKWGLLYYYVDVGEHKKRDLTFILFSIIGVFNTLFDLVLYVIFYNLSHSIIIANLIATTAALIGSYFLNGRVAFKNKQLTLKKFLLFMGVTAFGLWVVQTGLILLLTPLTHHVPASVWRLAGSFAHLAKTVLPKLIATGVTFVWNFVWYHKVIFRQDNVAELAIRSLE